MGQSLYPNTKLEYLSEEYSYFNCWKIRLVQHIQGKAQFNKQ